ncbi:hypothetical protein APR12_006535 [Nocardia amikacinitolerans]|uniref:hypothetical protein n=1 Tax=Nocardia amikacinitolerans TaxID=756689 RepID=UPI000AD4177B|nr:hypothetical protein [Nocardia amikacinitolerans]MCP2321145.1 hypothetical protein [Nocardia amikacinitolerans]
MSTTQLAAVSGDDQPDLARDARRPHRPLLWSSAAMAALVLFSLGGMIVDDRTLLGESVWLKTFKFGVAFAVYEITLAWLLSLPHKGSRATWWLGTVFAVTGVLDVGFIVVQAARGTFSHFNSSGDPVNSIGQMVFATGVPGLFFANLLIVLILSWQRLVDRPTARAVHAGLALAVAGMALGYLMGFTGEQLVRDADGQVVELVAGHTVLPEDAPAAERAIRDTAEGMPLTHWSTIGGDLRVPHFVGLHGIQVLLLATFLLTRLARRHRWLRPEPTRAALMAVLALTYTGVLAITFWQAMRAQPLIHPDPQTLTAYAALFTVATATTFTIYHRGHRA